MTTLSQYNQFNGRHWETGTVHNFFAYRGYKAPHTGDAYSEALLLGVSGGVTFGYFNFAYEGYDPQCNILTRNTFDPWDTMLSRLGVIQNIEHTLKEDRANAKLIDTLAGGLPAIVWPDMWGLPYHVLPFNEGMWGAFPLIVYGYEPDQNVVYIADRAERSLTVTPAELAKARARIKKDKFRLMTLEAPNPDKISSAVHLGICDTVKLFTEKPPKGSKNNFGLNGLQYWAKMLTNPKQRQSWAKIFPAGLPLYAGLTSAYEFAFLFGKGTAVDAERGLYADFLDEAAVILQKSSLREVAQLYRASARTWSKIPQALLPDEYTPLKETRQLMTRKHELFLNQGNDAVAEIQQINRRLSAIRQLMIDDFPLTSIEVEALQQNLAEQIFRLHDSEKAAVDALAGEM
jgi:hypothetical protein